MKLLTKKVPSYLLILALLIGALGTLAFTKFTIDKNDETASSSPVSVSSSCDIKINRLQDRKFIRPLLFAERNCETESFGDIKSQLIESISNLKNQGLLTNASVYLRLFHNGEWICINDDISYQPGSLFKVPLLITLLRKEEKEKGYLNKTLTFNNVTNEAKQFTQAFLKDKIQLGKSYTIKELMKYMIVNSDNNATMLLFNNIPTTEFEKTFTDLGLDKNMTKSDGVISAKDYSKFWLTLFNGSYLNFDNSEFALQLLSKSDFNEGIKSAIPQNVLLAHKFGEKGNTNEFCLHETGIVYSNNTPYLVTIMTNGNNQKNLVTSIQKIASTVYNNMQNFTK